MTPPPGWVDEPHMYNDRSGPPYSLIFALAGAGIKKMLMEGGSRAAEAAGTPG